MPNPPSEKSVALQAALAHALPEDRRWAEPGAIAWVDETGSTNADLVALGQQARAQRTPIAPRMLRMAGQQTGGRGRLARGWSTPAGAGLAMSIGLRLALAPAALSGFALVCGLAVQASLTALGAAVRLKWPNDVLAAGTHAKLGGILVEIVQLDARQTWVVVGIGLNLHSGAQLSAQWGRPIADLRALGVTVEPQTLGAAIAAAFEARVAVFEREGFAPFVAGFNAVHAFHGRRVSIDRDDDAAWQGQCVGVGARGEVLVRRDDGVVMQVISGDVSMAAAEA